MSQSIYHRLSRILWGAIVILIVLLAVYVSVGRMLASLTSSYQREILETLNQRVPFQIDADQVSSEWYSFTPVLVLNGLRLTLPGEQQRSLELLGGRIAFDVIGSLLSRSLQLTQLSLEGLSLAGELDDNGRLRVRGLGASDPQIGEWLEGFLANVERVVFEKSHFDLGLANGGQRDLEVDLLLAREGSRRRLTVKLSSSEDLQVLALAEGVGNPFVPETFRGQLYLDIDATDVGAIAEVMGDSLGDLKISGGLGLELWSSWDQGVPGAELRLEMTDARLGAADKAWEVPFDRLAFDARLESRNGGWLLAIAGLEFAHKEAIGRVPSLQLDARGQTMTLRARALELGPLTEFFVGGNALPPTVTELLKVLNPRGSLPALQLDVTDTGSPSAGWQLRANFDDLAVDHWHGAPAVAGATGFLDLAPGAGLVVLDSTQFSMAFPGLYEEPLTYEEFRGDFHINWSGERVDLSTGLVEALGEEGPVRVLFGLAIPLVETEAGVEMDLLVGLHNTASVHRAKYVPYLILDEPLRAWLATSIGEGMIAEAGFLWRGSLTAPAAALHTFQLFLNLENMALSYHPDWPALSDIDGTVLLDDSNVSVWAEGAALLGSRISDLSVEVWTDQDAELWLAVNGHLLGLAADGLAVVNTSPLNDLVGGAFTQWAISGQLAADIEFLLNLGAEPAPPAVSVRTRLSAVDLDIHPGDLPLRGINGDLNYDSSLGFSSSELAGQLWGRPLQVELKPAPKPATVSVVASSSVAMNDVQQWLGLELLGFARGESAVSVEVVAGGGVPTAVSVESSLAGVVLDLPSPWGKAADIEQRLRLTLTLDGDSTVLDINLEDGLAGLLALEGDKLQAASVSFGAAPAALQAGKVVVGGRAASVDVGAWKTFLDSYVGNAESTDQLAKRARPLSLSIEQLQLDEFILGGRDLGPVQLQVADTGGELRVTAEADWLRAALSYSPQGRSRLDVSYLDLLRLDMDREQSAAEDAADDEAVEQEIIQLPDLAVTIAGLRRGDTVLGNLSFDLHSEGVELHAQNIRGDIAAMKLRAEEPGALVWHQGANSRTLMAARLHFQDLGVTLGQLGYQKVIETDQGYFDLALEWPGGPQDYSLLAGLGSVDVDIGKGTFPEASGGTAGTLKVVSILNLAEIVRRLSLTQMFESGIPFNRIDGRAQLGGGTIDVSNMSVQGSASRFQFSGKSVVESQTLAGELVVTLPVANNLPWVAALAAGLPVAAGVFLLSKVFESQVDRLTSAVYSVAGTWDDPEVTFDRVFDNTAAADAANPAADAAAATKGSQSPSESP